MENETRIELQNWTTCTTSSIYIFYLRYAWYILEFVKNLWSVIFCSSAIIQFFALQIILTPKKVHTQMCKLYSYQLSKYPNNVLPLDSLLRNGKFWKFCEVCKSLFQFIHSHKNDVYYSNIYCLTSFLFTKGWTCVTGSYDNKLMMTISYFTAWKCMFFQKPFRGQHTLSMVRLWLKFWIIW